MRGPHAELSDAGWIFDRPADGISGQSPMDPDDVVGYCRGGIAGGAVVTPADARRWRRAMGRTVWEPIDELAWLCESLHATGIPRRAPAQPAVVDATTARAFHRDGAPEGEHGPTQSQDQ